MNLFEAVKDVVPTRTVAEHYGIEVKRNGMACCPFHDDRTPSMKVDKRFHCFGCQEDGDVIDFVGKLFGLSPKELPRSWRRISECGMRACKHGSPRGGRSSYPNWWRRSTTKRRSGAAGSCAGISICSVTGRSNTHQSRRTRTGIPCSAKPCGRWTMWSICWTN